MMTKHYPQWFDGKQLNEVLFCEEFLQQYPMVSVTLLKSSAVKKRVSFCGRWKTCIG